MDKKNQSAFTLVELLVVFGVIFILIDMIMPAIQKVRAAADRLVCANQLRQLGTALHMYHGDYGALPSGVSPNRPNTPYPYLGWQARILPHVEQDTAWNQIQQAYRANRSPFVSPPHTYFSKPLKLFPCPSDERLVDAQLTRRGLVVGLTSYVGVLGSSWNQPDGCLYVDSRVRLTDIRDGTTQTIMVGERPPSPDFWFGWWYASVGVVGTGSPDLLLGGKENNAFGSYVGGCPTGPYVFAQGKLDNMCDVFHFWSLHPGGAHFLMADASVHFLNYSAAPLIPELCTRNGGEMVELP